MFALRYLHHHERNSVDIVHVTGLTAKVPNRPSGTRHGTTRETAAVYPTALFQPYLVFLPPQLKREICGRHIGTFTRLPVPERAKWRLPTTEMQNPYTIMHSSKITHGRISGWPDSRGGAKLPKPRYDPVRVPSRETASVLARRPRLLRPKRNNVH